MHTISREKLIESITDAEQVWDIVIVGGGATGLGTAVDAASRGYKTLLLEQSDFAKGTSSRSTKLVHGGVRYLAQGNVSLVREALHERGLLLKNAGHLVKNEAFIIPFYSWWSGLKYIIGLKVYDFLAGKLSFGKSKLISRKSTLKRLPTIIKKGLKGGVVYHDGQFDDARLAVNLAQTCIEQGATALNYFKVVWLTKEDDKINGVVAKNVETGKIYTIKSRAVVNATGVFVDDLIQKDQPDVKALIQSSQGIHIVVDREFMPGADALMIPKTDDGRVLFVVPWHRKLLIGTTDTPLNTHMLDPVALDEEVNFVLATVAKYIAKAPGRSDIRSIFAGLRPLAAPQDDSQETKEISRSHKIIISPSGLITIIGGKWTTYRRMAQDVVDKIIELTGLEHKPCVTENLSIHGNKTGTDFDDPLYIYGTDTEALLKLTTEHPEWAAKLHPRLDYNEAEVIFAIRHEMPRTLEDVLSRRLRALVLDAHAAIEMAPHVAALMAKEMRLNEVWQQKQVADFTRIAQGYLLGESIK